MYDITSLILLWLAYVLLRFSKAEQIYIGKKEMGSSQILQEHVSDMEDKTEIQFGTLELFRLYLKEDSNPKINKIQTKIETLQQHLTSNRIRIKTKRSPK
jgi:hypothetical protein